MENKYLAVVNLLKPSWELFWNILKSDNCIFYWQTLSEFISQLPFKTYYNILQPELNIVPDYVTIAA